MIDVLSEKIGKSTITWLPQLKAKIMISANDITKSWHEGIFLFQEENLEKNINGLRSPQIGALHASLAYVKSDFSNAATVVMPTGTGKTETILSLVIAGKFEKTLVLVPSDALREQTKNKFIKLGLLRDLGVINRVIQNPKVATIMHKIESNRELTSLLDCNVIISTVSALSGLSNNHLEKISESCSHLIIDEAHHVQAKTWLKIKNSFFSKPVFQFTATPFRADRSRVEGQIIFNYSLKRAQKDGYFQPIDFHPIQEFIDEQVDVSIASKAIELLRLDLSKNYNHILMARTSTIKRSKEVFAIYEKEKDLKPVRIDSNISDKKKKKILEDIKSGEHKVIVCVNMLGEGFDLPELKIAALHDVHKSINIMLQFIGRFTRVKKSVGNAKLIANIADPKVNDELEVLYYEDSNWNNLIGEISSLKISQEESEQKFREEFSKNTDLLKLDLQPKTSTQVYEVSEEDWLPIKLQQFINKKSEISAHTINDNQDLIVIITKDHSSVAWSRSKELLNKEWNLYVFYYVKELQLLFVHCSSNEKMATDLLNNIAKKTQKVQGDKVFRVLSNIKRLRLQNVGLNKFKYGLRYSMHTGTDINDQIPDIEANRSIKSNIFGKGYSSGVFTSIGCSHKGKIWSMDSSSIFEWRNWCLEVGKKIIDDSIDTNEVLKTIMQTEELSEYPDLVAVNVDWPRSFQKKYNEKIEILGLRRAVNLLECELYVSPKNIKGKKINFEMRTPIGISKLSVEVIKKGEVKYTSADNLTIETSKGKIELVEYFRDNNPLFFLLDTSVIEGGYRYIPGNNNIYLYDKKTIEVWDWDGVDISIESQGEAKISNSIQFYTIQKIMGDYDVVFDDDGSGEIADIVAIKNVDNKKIIIDLYHCKYCPGGSKPGARLSDIYEVSGQAGKSVNWLNSPKEDLINQLIKRERLRINQKKSSRIDKGKLNDLNSFLKMVRLIQCEVGVNIVQPAISKQKVSEGQLSVLGSTYLYIEEVSGVKLRVITSE